MRCGKVIGKVWLFRYQDPATGKQKELKFGNYPELSLSDARDLWDELRGGGGRNRGDDPARELELSDADEGVMTIRELCLKFVTEYASVVKRSWKEDERLLNRHLVPVFGDMPVTAFTHKEAAELLNGILSSGTPREAEKMRAVIQTMYNVACGRTRKISTLEGTWLPPTTDNPVINVFLPWHTAKNHKPTRSELQGLLNGLVHLPSGDVFRLQALTMSRISEVANLTWSELDLDEGRWVLPAQRAKNGREHVVLLSGQVVDLLERVRSLQNAGCVETTYVFPSPTDPKSPKSPSAIQQQLAKNRGKMGLAEGFTSHSLRHAALTWAAENGCPRDVRDRLTNHVSGGGVDAIYNAATLNQPAKEWWQRWADYLDTVAKPEEINAETVDVPSKPD